VLDLFPRARVVFSCADIFCTWVREYFSIPCSRTYAHHILPGCGIKQKTVSSRAGGLSAGSG